MRFALIFCVLLLCGGCVTSQTQTRSVERTTGMQGGHATDLTTTRSEQASSETSIDYGPAIRAAVSAAMGDVRGAIQTIADRPQPGGIDATTGGAIGAAGGMALLALRELLAHRRTLKDSDEAWEHIKGKA